MKTPPKAAKRKPTHPGALLREDVLPAMTVTQGELAARIGVSRRSVNMVLNEKRPMTPDFAIRLGRLLNHDPQVWLRMQTALDLWELEQHNAALYRGITPMRAAA